jgi:phospholipase/lecithinase/hemolysin
MAYKIVYSSLAQYLFIWHRWRCTFNILSLSMNYEQRVIIQFLYKEKVHPTQIHRRLAAQYVLEIYSLRNVQH